jgi:hypothetical protein
VKQKAEGRNMKGRKMEPRAAESTEPESLAAVNDIIARLLQFRDDTTRRRILRTVETFFPLHALTLESGDGIHSRPPAPDT